MGEAKRRGSYEQRVAEGKARLAREELERQVRRQQRAVEAERRRREAQEKERPVVIVDRHPAVAIHSSPSGLRRTALVVALAATVIPPTRRK